jgi:UDP-N-acetylmuramate dehydrogenase
MSATATLDAAAAALTERVGDRLRRDVPLAPMTTYRVGGPAALFLDVASLDDLTAVAEVRAATGLPVLVVGRGSNMLVADPGFAGLAISIAAFAHTIDIPDVGHRGTGDEVMVTAGGGVALPVLARQTAAANVRGFEWAVGVPGTIGGAVRMNAGGHGSDMAACLRDVDVIDLDDGDEPGAVRTIPAVALGLRFRASSLASGAVVLSARLRLRVGSRADAEAELAEVVRWRREHQPGGQNCGSVFVNPVPGEVAAGALIDGLGLRGMRIGTACVSDKHANFIQADDGGAAADVRAVMEAVRARVADATGFRLRSEVRLVGFDDADPLSFDDQQAGADR